MAFPLWWEISIWLVARVRTKMASVTLLREGSTCEFCGLTLRSSPVGSRGYGETVNPYLTRPVVTCIKNRAFRGSWAHKQKTTSIG